MAKIMLVEDDANLQSIYGDRLMAEGHTIISARDGEEALSLAMKEKPDLVISDIMMPKISGFDMLDIMRTTPETKDIKIIMMTALSQAEDKARADKLGADKYLVKSQVTLDDVARVVDEVVGANKTPVVIGAVGPEEAGAVTDKETVVKAPEPSASTPPETPQSPSSESPALPSDAETPLAVASEGPVGAPPLPAASTSIPVTSDDSAASDQPVATDPIPTPSVEDPTPTSAPVSSNVDNAEKAVVDAAGVTTETEQAALTSQIDDFLSKNLPDTPLGDSQAGPTDTPVPAQPTETAAEPELAPPPELITSSENNIAVATDTPADASGTESQVPTVPAPEPEVHEPTAPVPAEPSPQQAAESPVVAEPQRSGGERVIQPTPGFNLDKESSDKKLQDLLDRETAKEIANSPVTPPPTGTVIEAPKSDETPPSPHDIAL